MALISIRADVAGRDVSGWAIYRLDKFEFRTVFTANYEIWEHDTTGNSPAD